MGEHDLVFPSTVGTPFDPSNLLKRFRKSPRDAGSCKIGFRDLRHTAATLMLNNQVDVLIASWISGQATPSITLDVYGHLPSAVHVEVPTKMEKIIRFQ